MSNRPIERVLVLSGGGARGAYQVGVCKYLYSQGWQPDMILGNSIGATNGAILVAPNYEAVDDLEAREKITNAADLLEYIWLQHMVNRKLYNPLWHPRELAEAGAEPSPPLLLDLLDVLEDPERDPEAFEDLVGKAEQELGPEIADFTERVAVGSRSLDMPEREVTRELIRFLSRTYRRVRGLPALIPRPGWRQLLEEYVDQDRLNGPEATYFGIASTDVATGALQMFWNRRPPQPEGTENETEGEETGIRIRHIMSSSSIPGIYRATRAEAGQGEYRYRWDGVLVANAPIAPAIDRIDSVERIIVVLMAPWSEHPEGPAYPDLGAGWTAAEAAEDEYVPTVGEALKRHVDWWMLAPLRSELRKLTPEQRKNKVRIVWPIDIEQPGSSVGYLTNPVSIIHYTRKRSRQLIARGFEDAKKKGL